MYSAMLLCIGMPHISSKADVCKAQQLRIAGPCAPYLESGLRLIPMCVLSSRCSVCVEAIHSKKVTSLAVAATLPHAKVLTASDRCHRG